MEYTINVVNKRKHKPTLHDFYAGRPSVLGNPYTFKDEKTLAKYLVATREESILKYEDHFKESLKNNELVKLEFENILNHLKKHKEVNLICWCAPLSCHCDILKKYLIQRV